MGTPFRLGLIGAGRVTISCHLPAALSLPDVKVAALVDPTLGRTEKLARNYGLDTLVTSNLNDVLGKIDGAIVATPNHLHADVACALLEAGIPVLIEKPLAASQQDGQRMIDAATRTGVPAGVGYTSRFQDNVLLMEELLRKRHFGHIERFAYQVGSRGGWAPFSAYNLNREQTGGGVVMVTGTHFLDRMLAWFGMPEAVAYYDDGEAGPESNAIIRLTFQDDEGPFSGLIRFSKTCPLSDGLVMETTSGRVVMKENATDWPILKPRDKPGVQMELKPTDKGQYAPTLNGFQRQLLDFVKACRTGGQPMVPLSVGLDSLRLINQMYSARQPLSTDWYTGRVTEEVAS